MNELLLTQKDYDNFRDWLNLNLDGLTWQGRFKKEFELFWETFFEENLSLSQIFERYQYSYSSVSIGSLSSWFLWLRNKFIAYVFIFKQQSIDSISLASKLSPSDVATILRNFLLDEYPHLDHMLTEKFSVGNILSENLNLTFEKLRSEINLLEPEVGSREDEIMPSMEVTLFDEWSTFIKKMKNDFTRKNFNLDLIKERSSFIKQLKIFQDVAVLLLIFTITVVAVKEMNRWYEKYLLNKVSIYEPQFSWLNKSLVFKAGVQKPTKEYKLNFNEIKDITKGEKLTEFFDPNEYSEESEATLTSFEDIPKDFSKADKEPSLYEGGDGGANGYRETKNGTTKIYRLMMTSTNVYASRDQIDKILEKYKGEEVGDTIAGMDVPGGVYYNVYIPRSELKNFLSETMKVSQGKLFESNTSNVKNVPGKTRVFIMVKSI